MLVLRHANRIEREGGGPHAGCAGNGRVVTAPQSYPSSNRAIRFEPQPADLSEEEDKSETASRVDARAQQARGIAEEVIV